MNHKRKIFEAYIDGSGLYKDYWGNLVYPMYGYLITKEGTYLVADDEVKENHMPPQVFKTKKNMTNNQAEYLGLKALVDWLPRSSVCVVYSDSQLVVCQIGGEKEGLPCKWQCQDPKLKQIKTDIEETIKIKNLNILLKWIPREKNSFGKVLEGIKKKIQKKRGLHHV